MFPWKWPLGSTKTPAVLHRLFWTARSAARHPRWSAASVKAPLLHARRQRPSHDFFQPLQWEWPCCNPGLYMELSTPLGYLTYLSEIYKGSGILTPKNVCSQTAASEERHEVNRRLRVLQKPAKNQSSFGIGSLTQTWIVEHQKNQPFLISQSMFSGGWQVTKMSRNPPKKVLPKCQFGELLSKLRQWTAEGHLFCGFKNRPGPQKLASLLQVNPLHSTQLWDRNTTSIYCKPQPLARHHFRCCSPRIPTWQWKTTRFRGKIMDLPMDIV